MKKHAIYEVLEDFERHDVETEDGAKHINHHDFDQTGARWRVAFGSRVGGKTYAYKLIALENMLKGRETMYLRRYEADVDPSIVGDLWDDITADGTLKKYAEKKFSGWEHFDVELKKRHFILRGYRAHGENETEVKPLYDLGPCCSMSNWVRYKSTPFPAVDDMIFDEFLTPERKLKGEFARLINMRSTVFRKRDGTVWLFGNTVDRSCEILEGMSIDIRKIPEGMSVAEFREISPETNNYIYNRVAVYYYGSAGQTDESRSAYIFGNRSDAMIVNGEWETEHYNIIDYDIMSIRQDVYDDAYCFQRGYLTLYLYEYDDMIYISDKRIPCHDIEYTMIFDQPTNKSRNQYNISHPAVIDLMEKINKINMDGNIYFSNDLAGEDFSRNFLPIISIK